MADVAFLLLVFFLVTSSLDPNTGIYRQLASTSSEDILKNIDIRDRNLMQLLINESNLLYLDKENIPLSQLKSTAKLFIENPENRDYLPEIETVEIPEIGEYPVTKHHIIQLEIDRTSNYQTYISVLSELTAAYAELREELAKKQFHRSFAQLSKEQKDAVLEIYPQRISEEEIKEGGMP